MDSLILLLKFFGGIILFFSVGSLIGYLLKLDKKYEEMQKELKKSHSNKTS
jgi:hypothetical protein